LVEGLSNWRESDEALFLTVCCIALCSIPALAQNKTAKEAGMTDQPLRQWCKRLTRLTYAFSKKKENLRAALALHFWFYNFARVHGSLRVTPAMEARLADHIWRFPNSSQISALPLCLCLPDNPLLELRQRAADVGKNVIDGGGYIVDAGDAHKCDQGDQQCIFDQILTFFVIPQGLEFRI
jgi:hypothetical protein